jgi:hypothetical protein
MNPPRVYEDTKPSNQRTIKMTAIVHSISFSSLMFAAACAPWTRARARI